MKTKTLKIIIFVAVLCFVLCGLNASAQFLPFGSKKIDKKETTKEGKTETPETVFQNFILP